jgi:organic radical activating enzyme
MIYKYLILFIKISRLKQLKDILNKILIFITYLKIKEDPLYQEDMNNGLLRIRITNKCNGKCRYCGLLSWSEEDQNMSMNSQWLYDYCKPLYERIKLLLITGGDAYVARESFHYMKFISENYPQITIITESNGIAFSDKYQQLASDHLFKTHFSVNASNAQMFKKGCWQGEGAEKAYEKLMKNIKSYIDLLKSKNLECFAPSLSMVVNKDTASDIIDFVKLSLSLGISHNGFYFDYTENDMGKDYFGIPEISRPALRTLMEIERVLARKVFVGFRLWLPLKEAEPIQKEVDAVPIAQLREKYREIFELAKNRSMDKENKLRNKIRMQRGKKPLNVDEEWNASMKLVDKNNKKVCFAPWSEIDLYPNGRMDFCGWFKPTLNLNHFIKNNKVDWNEILNSPEYMFYRKKIYEDKFDGCMDCCPMNSKNNPIIPTHKYGYDRVEE